MTSLKLNLTRCCDAEIDLYKFSPWDLPGKALYGEKEWYFFSPRDRKYPNGSRPNRTAGAGYWKATGADKPVGKPKPLGIKKGLVFYAGKPLKGVKTNWIMHEYRLANVDRSAGKRNNPRLDDWVLCRLYNKKGTIEKHYSVDQKTLQFSDSEEQKPKIGICPYNGMVNQMVPLVQESQSMALRNMSDCLHLDAPESIPKLHTDSSSSENVLSPEFTRDKQVEITSNYCFYAAANHTRRGEANIMVTGGTEAAIIPIGLGGFVACRALSQRNDNPKTASRPREKDRDVFVMGEGAGICVNCDAYHMTDSRANGLGISSCNQSGLEAVGVSTEEWWRFLRVALVSLFPPLVFLVSSSSSAFLWRDFPVWTTMKSAARTATMATLNSASSNRPTLSKDIVSNNLPMSQVMSISSPPPPQAFGTQDSMEAITNLH
ncbi:unnamed protein product [Fraxinus pennsylvanica]|uniref:NAC domain-containing protein n=1 Tax=Fraxinus pennsylvanica TaxID=56036 RepID=A0AAD2DT95_9LAMI|nr:unnamed protein product [Fraxinus pennsylvanica]